jgi:hypothetical protein
MRGKGSASAHAGPGMLLLTGLPFVLFREIHACLPFFAAVTNLAGGLYSAVATTGIMPCPPGRWAQARLVLGGYPSGCRRAVVALKGEGNTALLGQNVGFWGAKFAAPTLRLLPPDEAVARG